MIHFTSHYQKTDVWKCESYTNKTIVNCLEYCRNFNYLFTPLAPLFLWSVTLLYDCYFSRAQTNTDVFVLTKKDLDEVFTHSPEIRKKILETAEERQKIVAERAKTFTEKNEEEEEDKKSEEENRLKVLFYNNYWNSGAHWLIFIVNKQTGTWKTDVNMLNFLLNCFLPTIQKRIASHGREKKKLCRY